MNRAPRTSPRGRPFYGWVVVGALVWILMVGIGITFYGLSVYLAALAEGPGGFSLGTSSTAIGLFLLTSGFAGLAVARWLRRVQARVVFAAGTLVSAVAVMLIGRSETTWQLHASYLLLGLGFSAHSLLPASQLVTAWFDRRRTVAMSITFVGLPLGGTLVTPLVAVLVESRGIEGAGPWLAGALVVLIWPALPLLHSDPADRGTTPDGAPAPLPPTPDGTVVAMEGVARAEAVRSSWFVLSTLALALGMFGQLGTLSHLYNIVAESIPSVATVSVSVVTASSLVGRLAGSWALTRVHLARTTILLLVAQCAAMLALAFNQQVWAFVLAAVVFGITVGNMHVLQPLLLSERFGDRDFAAIYARANLLVTFGMAAGPPAVGLLHDWLGSYPLPLVAVAAPVAVGAALMAWVTRAPAHPAPHTHPTGGTA